MLGVYCSTDAFPARWLVIILNFIFPVAVLSLYSKILLLEEKYSACEIRKDVVPNLAACSFISNSV